MSKLDSISICGIRSFGIEEGDTQKIKLYSPLTLFLGQNGCGKTTIIESIRHACTGELPGGTKGTKGGQGFISDPYMHTVSHVLGQIRLNIIDVKGSKATIVRIMKCEKSGTGGLKFSTLNSTMKFVKPDGQEETRSGRSEDLNALCIQLLGVPKSILNNVIFCHQENSLWPLEESTQLKKKFDEIFESVEYNKCVDTLRKQFKIKSDNLKVLKVHLKSYKDLKDEVGRKKLGLQDKENKHKALVIQVSECEEKIKPVDERLNAIYQFEINLAELEKKKASKDSEKKSVIEIQASIKANITKEYSGSDLELNEEINSFQEKRNEEQVELLHHKKQKQQIESQEENLEEVINKKQITLAQTENDISTYKSKLNERNALIKSISKSVSCNIKPIESNEDAETAITVITLAIDKKEKSLNSLSEEIKNSEKVLQANVDSCREKYVQVEQEISLKTKEVKELQRKSRDISAKLKDLSVSDEKLKGFQRKIADIDKDLDKLNSAFNEEELSKAIDKDKQEIRRLNSVLEKLEEEYKIWQKNSVTENELENLKTEILSKETEIHRIENGHFDQFKLLFQEVPKSQVKRQVEQLQKENSNKVTVMNNKILTAQKLVTKLETEIKHQTKVLNDSENDLTKCRNEISRVCGNLEYNKKCVELEQEINKLQRRKGQLSSAKLMYEAFVDDISSKKCCPICSTNFDSKENAIKEIVGTMKNKIQDIPRNLKNVQAELEKAEDLNKTVVQLKSSNDRIQELAEKIIPNLQQELEKLNNNLKSQNEILSRSKEDLKKPQEIFENCGKVISSAALIDQHCADIKKSKERIGILNTQLIKIESTRSKQQTEAEIEDTKMDLNTLREESENKNKKLNINRKRSTDLKEQRNAIVETQLKLQESMQGKPQLEESLKETNEKELKFQDDIEVLKGSLIILKNDLDEAKMDLDGTKASNNVTLKATKEEYYSYVNKLEEIKKIQSSIKSDSEKDFQGKYHSVLEELQRQKLKKQELVNKKEIVTKAINDSNVLMAKQEHYFRELKDNLNLREKRKLEKVIDTELNELKQKIGDQDYKSVLKEKVALQRKRNEIDKDIQMKTGKIEELLTTINEIKKDLERPENKTINVVYRNKCIETKVNEIAIQNIKSYAEALENAICKFHKSRMMEINKNIRQLWRQIYKGNDIEFIEIDSGDLTYSGIRRSYNYRVMQKKNDTLLEMRGRCSAGQKVLACLIIRIALSETFSSNCGILALDEPTTNLDRENIESLSLSLAQIINTRKAQKNFQLLIITHDEEFLKTLRTVDSLRYYYKVSRNHRGCTIITSESL